MLSPLYLISYTSLSEQLIPMFGLVALENQLQPETTFDKITFLIENVWSHAHELTTIISFGALVALMLFRSFKNCFKNTWWIYRLPEVLVFVVLATSRYFFIPLGW